MRPLSIASVFCVGMQRVVVLLASSGLPEDSFYEISIIGESVNATYN